MKTVVFLRDIPTPQEKEVKLVWSVGRKAEGKGFGTTSYLVSQSIGQHQTRGCHQINPGPTAWAVKERPSWVTLESVWLGWEVLARPWGKTHMVLAENQRRPSKVRNKMEGLAQQPKVARSTDSKGHSTRSGKVSDTMFLGETLGLAHPDRRLYQLWPQPQLPANTHHEASSTPEVTLLGSHQTNN